MMDIISSLNLIFKYCRKVLNNSAWRFASKNNQVSVAMFYKHSPYCSLKSLLLLLFSLINLVLAATCAVVEIGDTRWLWLDPAHRELRAQWGRAESTNSNAPVWPVQSQGCVQSLAARWGEKSYLRRRRREIREVCIEEATLGCF